MDEEERNFQEDRAERPCCQSQLPVLSYNSLGSAHPARQRKVTSYRTAAPLDEKLSNQE